MRYATVCSGIEAPSVAWEPLGWEPVWFSEIEPFPCAVLKHHYCDVPNLGDMTQIDYAKATGVDLLVAGTPCQSFSIIGNRQALDDPRGQLALATVRALAELRPRWFLWENVAGALSADKGRAFGRLLSSLDELGYCSVWTVLDAQHFGVPQLRRRVYLLAYSGPDFERPGEVLLKPDSRGVHRATAGRSGEEREWFWGEDIASCLTANYKRGVHCGGESYVRASGLYLPEDYQWCPDCDEVWCPTCEEHFADCSCLGVSSEFEDGRYRRLMPVECERLMGFPDDYTRIPWRGKAAEDCPDSPRYKALGNSMAVPVVRWIGERIQQVEELTDE